MLKKNMSLLLGNSNSSANSGHPVSKATAYPQTDTSSNRPHSVLVTGTGRSGTSCLAGLFSKGGWYQGDSLYAASDSNPKGFFENEVINSLNEALIVASLDKALADSSKAALLGDYRPGQLWLARLPGDLVCDSNDALRVQIRELVRKRPFCFKDPRFNYTANIWLEEAPDARVLCVFRDPAMTVESILKECRTAPYLREFRISVEDAFSLWRLTYLRLLSLYQSHAHVFFICYHDLFVPDKLEQLETLVGQKLDRAFPEKHLNRSRPAFTLDPETQDIFATLMAIAGNDFGVDRAKGCRHVEYLIDKRKSRFPREPQVQSRPSAVPAQMRAHVEMLQLQSERHLENFADSFGDVWFDPESRQLRLQFQLVSLFKDAPVGSLLLNVLGESECLRLEARQIASPYVGKKYTGIPWAAQSRLKLDETLTLPAAFSGATMIDLVVEIGGVHQAIGVIHLNPSPSTSGME